MPGIGGQSLCELGADGQVDRLLVEHATEIRKLGKRALADIVEIGRRLTECREILRELFGHGHWYNWLESQFGWSKQAALNFVRVYEMSQSTKFVGLDLPDLALPVSALYLLAAPKTPETVQTEILERAKTEKVFVADVKKAIAGARTNKVPKTEAKSAPAIPSDTKIKEAEAVDQCVARVRQEIEDTVRELHPALLERLFIELRALITDMEGAALPVASQDDAAVSAEAHKEHYRGVEAS
jgi:hypothetical protein